MEKDIHKQLIKRLVAGWLCLSLLIGGLVAFAEFERIDRKVLQLAQDDSSLLVAAYREYFRDPGKGKVSALQGISRTIVGLKKFVMIEFYDRGKNKITKYSLPHIQDITDALEQEQHDFLMGEEVDYMKVIHGRNIYLKIVLPISADKGGAVIGYFEGIYHVADRDVARIIRGVVWSILQVVIVIFLTTLILYPVIISLNRNLLTLSKDLAKANIGMLKVLGGAIAKRDSDTNAHNYRVTIYAIRLAEKLGLPEKEIRALVKGAFLHDMGKIAISDTILLKPAKLTEDEFAVMQTHVSHGVDIVRNYQWLNDAVAVIANHHEKYRGDGYLQGLVGEKIPRNARIFAIVDVFDALTSKRPYKEAFSYEKSVAILKESRGSHFDPRILDVFLGIAPELYEQAQCYDNEKEAELNKILEELVRKYFPV